MCFAIAYQLEWDVPIREMLYDLITPSKAGKGDHATSKILTCMGKVLMHLFLCRSVDVRATEIDKVSSLVFCYLFESLFWGASRSYCGSK